MAEPAQPPTINIVPANEASWEDLQLVLGTRGDPARCQCQRYKISEAEYRAMTVDERALRLREQTDCGYPDSGTTSGLVAYLDGEPAGWCNVEPRSGFERLLGMPIPWAGRTEDKRDSGVWAVTCFVVRAGFRRQGVSRALAQASVDFARARGARALEAYPMDTQPGVDITWGELHVGSHSIFAAAGFREVTHPTKRRSVMRIDFDDAAPSGIHQSVAVRPRPLTHSRRTPARLGL
jgi:GNAT superfamily N-acetyltransferase